MEYHYSISSSIYEILFHGILIQCDDIDSFTINMPYLPWEVTSCFLVIGGYQYYLNTRVKKRVSVRLLPRLFALKSLAKSLPKSLGSDPMHDSQRDSLRDSFFYADTNARGNIEIYFLWCYSSHFTDKLLRVYCLKY